MLGRFLPGPVLRGHWKGLSFYRDARVTETMDGQVPAKVKADVPARIFIVALPLAVGVSMLIFQWKLAAPSALLAGLALLAGGLLASFGQLSTLRLRLTEAKRGEDDGKRVDRDYLDETAAHLLTAAYFAALTAAVLVVGMNFGLDKQGALTGLWAAVAATLGTYVVLVFLMALPRLYVAYVSINSVRNELNGTVRK